MSYEEDGHNLENLSQFETSSFECFPNTYEDNKRIGACTEFSDEQLDNKAQEYAAFLHRPDLMPRARRVGERVLDHLIFEMAARDDELDQRKQEDEICGNL